MGVREQFYGELRGEFENDWAASFLCRYLAQERKTHPREDDYARLERCYALLERGKTTQREYLLLALEVLLKNSRLALGKGGKPLLDYGCALGLFQGKRWDRNKCTALQGALEKGEPKASMPAEDVSALHRSLLGAILHRDAQTFLYDADHRKKDRDMAMLDAYCADKDLVLSPGGGSRGSARLTRRELEQWEALLKLLRRQGRRRALIPIRIDPRSGAGLFIVGIGHYPDHLQKGRAACYYACVCLDELFTEFGGVTLSFHAFAEDLERSLGFPSLDEAQKWYYNELLQNTDTVMGIYQQHNGPIPKGCPKELELYFEPDEDSVEPESQDDLLQEGMAACERDTASGKKEKKPWNK